MFTVYGEAMQNIIDHQKIEENKVILFTLDQFLPKGLKNTLLKTEPWGKLSLRNRSTDSDTVNSTFTDRL